ncbi:TIGR03943 family putative permease subunit [Streptomyces sp. WG7]|uniref:TIGR03943 family putative permease subunit n=1 Tax=Streptomyces sp. WG7 TaxID=3417650 RepID=UPI003CE676F4
MSRYGPAVLLALTGAAVLRISLFGDLYLRYVQPGLRPYLIVSGAVLVLLAAATALTRRGDEHRDDEDADTHVHGAGGAGAHVPAGGAGGVGHGAGGAGALGHGFGEAGGVGHGFGEAGALGHGAGGAGGVGHGFGEAGALGHGFGEADGHVHGAGGAGGVGHGFGEADALGHGSGDAGGHGHSHGPAGPRVAWLLTLPALALLLFPPPALGSYSAEREAAQRAAQGVGAFPALPSGDPVELTLAEFGSRAIYDSERSLTGRTVRLTGFVTHGDDGTWYVTRLQVSCCAADATAGKAEIRGAGAPPVDAWVTVTGTWHPEGGLGSDAAWPPVLDTTDVRRVAQPANPYEKR